MTQRRGLAFWVMGVVALATAVACGAATESTGKDGAGSQTDWLSRCVDDSDCPEGSCLCGICTRPCDDDAMCGSVEGSTCRTQTALENCDAPPPKYRGVCADDKALATALEAAQEGTASDDDASKADAGAGDPSGPTGSGDDDDAPANGAAPAGPPSKPGNDPPQTTTPATKLDLLVVVDNSASMGDKQVLLAQSLPDLVQRFADPLCVSGTGESANATGGECPTGFMREFAPVSDIHVGVISTSLGGYGSQLDCTSAEEGETDDSHLLGSLERVQSELPSTPDFLSWCPPGGSGEASGSCSPTPETSNGDSNAFNAIFADQVRAAHEQGCGWESTLESWYRFLVEPSPWTQVVRQNCPVGGDTNRLCVGPETDPDTGLPFVDEILLDQRKRFLRPDSVLAILMLTDEDDCSFKASGQSWRLAQTGFINDSGQTMPSRAYKGSAVCATDPNDPCCVSCGTGPQAGCPTAVNADGSTVNAGCEEPLYKSADDLAQEGSFDPTDDAASLRCFDQKRRFGVDYLYPTSRYSNALSLQTICPFSDDASPDTAASDGTLLCGDTHELAVPNPLYSDLSFDDRRAADPNAEPLPVRASDRVFLAGIVGVPWQDLAVDRNASVLEYRPSEQLDWTALLGSSERGAPYDKINAPPTDPLMLQQIEPRQGTDATVNGGEWNILDKDDLQYACTFPLPEPLDCPALENLDPTGSTPSCTCTFYGDPAYANPLCNGNTQVSASAYPSIRPLQVLRDVGSQGVVASACAKNTQDANAKDYGYRPAMAALVDRVKAEFAQ